MTRFRITILVAAIACVGRTCVVLAIEAPALPVIQTTSLSPVVGLAEVGFTPPQTAKSGDLVVTVIQVTNQSTAPIAGLAIEQTWYDGSGAIIAVKRAEIDGLLQPRQTATMTIAVPYDSRMTSESRRFTHANGAVKPVVIGQRRGTLPALVPAKPETPGTADPGKSTVLEKVLTECRCVLSGMGSSLLATLVTDFGFFSDDSSFIVAYWTSEPEQQFQSNVPLHVIVGDRPAGTWREKDVPFQAYDDQPGPIDSIGRSNGLILIDRQVALDGASEILLSSDLEKLGNVYYELGSSPVVLPNGLVLYQRGQPHFAPTHTGWSLWRLCSATKRRSKPGRRRTLARQSRRS